MANTAARTTEIITASLLEKVQSFTAGLAKAFRAKKQ